MSIFHFVKVRFDRRRADIDQAWLNRRYAFFQEHTLQSLFNQTNKDWRLWISCDPGMRDMVAELRKIVPQSTVFTFGDAPPSRPEMLSSDWTRMLGSDYVYVTRIDSDDLYSSDALELAAAIRPESAERTEASLFRRGYMYDIRSNRLGVYYNPSPPFHTLMFPLSTFIVPERYEKVWNKIGDHSRVGSELRCHALPDWKFTVLIHDSNFLSTFDYSAEPDELIPRSWTIDDWKAQPIVFDVDDFCDKWNCLRDLDLLKRKYPHFKATLFTIPGITSEYLLREAGKRDWLELAVHGIVHDPDQELKEISGDRLSLYLRAVDYQVYAGGFRPPGWFITDEHIEACNQAGVWVALHQRDKTALGPKCRHGYYCCGDRLPSSHWHTHNTCQNWLCPAIPQLLECWLVSQRFAFVSEAVLVPQGAP